MAFSVTDESLAALDAAEPHDREQFLGTLKPEELDQIEKALPAFKAKKQSGPGPQYSEPAGPPASPSHYDPATVSSSALEPAPERAQDMSVQPGFAKPSDFMYPQADGSFSDQPRNDVAISEQMHTRVPKGQYGQRVTEIDNQRALADKQIAKPIAGMQEKARPILEAAADLPGKAFDAGGGDTNPAIHETGQVARLAARTILSPLGGDQLTKPSASFSPEDYRAAVTGLARATGGIDNAENVLGGLHFAGSVGIWAAVPEGIVGRAVEAAGETASAAGAGPLMTHLFKSAVAGGAGMLEGGAYNAAGALATKNASVGEAMVSGGQAGAALASGITGLSGILAVIPIGASSHLVKEVLALPEIYEMAPQDFKPTTAFEITKANGEHVVRAVQMDGKFTHYDLPMSDPEAMTQLARWKSKGLEVQPFSDRGGPDLPTNLDEPTSAPATHIMRREADGTVRIRKSLTDRASDAPPRPGEEVALTNGRTGTYVGDAPDGRALVKMLDEAKASLKSQSKVKPVELFQMRKLSDQELSEMRPSPITQEIPTKPGAQGSYSGLQKETQLEGPKTAAIRPQVTQVMGQGDRMRIAGAPAGGSPAVPSPQRTIRPPNPGDHVYFDMYAAKNFKGDAGRRYITGKVLGTASNGQLRLELNGGKITQVDADLVTTALSRDEVNSWKQVPAPPWIQPALGELPSFMVDEWNARMKVIQYGMRLQKDNPGIIDRLSKQLMGNNLSNATPPRLAQNSVMGQASNRLNNEIKEAVLNAFSKGGVQLESAFDRALGDFESGKLETTQIQNQYPAMWNKVGAMAERMRIRKELNSQLIRQLGGLEDVVSEENWKSYLARQYLSKKLKAGDWEGYARKAGLRDDAVNYIQAENARTGKIRSQEEIQLAVDKMLRAEDPYAEFRNNPQLGGPFQHLKRREDLPKVLRDAMGEMHSGAYRTAVSLGIQESLISQYKWFDEISKDPSLFSPGPQPGFKEVGDHGKYGKIRGGFIHPDLAEVVLNLPDTLNRSPAFIRSLSSLVKQNAIVGGGLGPILHHTMANIRYSIMAGGLDPFHPIQSGKDFYQAIQSQVAYHADPFAPGAAEIALEARHMGGVDPGIGHAEMADAEKRIMLKYMGDLKKLQPTNFWDLKGGVEDVVNKYQKFMADSSHMYDQVHQTFKLANYISLRRQNLAQGMDLPTARINAATEVNRSFPNPHNLGPLVDAARKTALGGIIPVLTPIAEEARILTQLPGRFMEDPKLRHRLMGWAIISAGTYCITKSLQKMWTGTTDEEIAAAQSLVKDKTAQYYPMLEGSIFKDEKGRIQLVDHTHDSTFLHLLRGNPNDSVPSRVFSNMTQMLVQNTPAANEIQDILSHFGVISPPPGQYKLREGEAGLLTGLQALNRMGILGPTAMSHMADAARSTGAFGPLSPSSEQLTPMQGVLNGTGLAHITPVTVPTDPGQASPAMAGKVKEIQGQIKDLMFQIKSPTATDGMRQAAVAKIKMLSASLQAIQAKVGAAQQAVQMQQQQAQPKDPNGTGK